MKEIPVKGSNRPALVDDDVFERVSQFKWRIARKRSGAVYVVRQNGKVRKLLLHRVVSIPPVGVSLDHKNMDGLDNRRENLRVCTNTQNQYNRRGNTGRTSKFKGVSWDSEKRRWRSQIRVAGRDLRLGRFDDEIEAARVYDAAAVQYHGEFARLNFR